MRKIREMLRLLWECGLSQRQVAGCCGIGKTTVAECVVRARRSGLDWSTAAALSDEELERRLYHRSSWCRQRIGQKWTGRQCIPS